ncbi:restriction endonuclease subunit S [Hyphomonas sp.]|uniref:restriction endonuclease subunit S n=1 Tax=Hyphomonas sp. TaxID=87 RepID=UPI0025C06493|nr:restriction endonuclease subunit S [Hyphomonas sp.]
MLEVAHREQVGSISEWLAVRDLNRLGVDVIPTGWSLSSVGDACDIRNELRLPIAVEDRAQMDGRFPYYGPTGVLGHINEYRAEGEFALIGEDGDHFLDPSNKPQTVRVSGRFNVNNHAHLVAGTDKCDVEWFAYFYRNRDIFHSLTRQGANRFKLTKASLERLPILLPPLSEQRRIAEILRTWDEAIEKLEALRAAKERLSEAVQLRLFEAEYEAQKNLKRAKEIFEPVSERGRTDLPLLAVMQDIGIVRRDVLERRVVMPEGDTSSYKVVRPGDFVISLRSFEGGLEHSQISGLVSPAYTVLRPTHSTVDEYFSTYFKSRSFVGRLDKLIFGIRDGKQIAFRDFGDMLIPAPPIATQRRAAEILSALGEDIKIETRRIAALHRQKRGLMQKLLTGEWRVSEISEGANG